MTQQTKQAKNYIVFANDESGSMDHLRKAAMNDYNANIEAVKNAASKEMQDTIVSMYTFGGIVERKIVNSNPHVLQPLSIWQARGGTPMNQAILDAIDLLQSMPDYNNPEVSFMIMATTDGESTDHYNRIKLTAKMIELSRDGRWTFVFRVPRGARNYLLGLNIPEGNIQEWDTTEAGMKASTAATTQAFTNYYAARSAGAKSSSVFYADASQVDTKALADVSGETSLYVVAPEQNGIQIRDFILTKRQQYLEGAAFYQLTKTESRVQHNKLIAIRDRSNGKIYSGDQARDMIGLPKNANARLHPGNHGNFDIFIQSKSVNRKLVANTGVLYWEKIGVPFTQEALNKFAPKTDAKGVVQLPAVVNTGKPTPSPLKPVKQTAPEVNGKPVKFFATRDEARKAGSAQDAAKYGITNAMRWFVFI